MVPWISMNTMNISKTDDQITTAPPLGKDDDGDWDDCDGEV